MIFMMISAGTIKSEESYILIMVGHGSINLLTTGEKATAKLKEHTEGKSHTLTCQLKALLLLHCIKVLLFSKCTDWKKMQG